MMILNCNRIAPAKIVQKVPRLNSYAESKPTAKEIKVTWFGVIFKRTAAQVKSFENLRRTKTENIPSLARLAIFKRSRAMFNPLISSWTFTFATSSALRIYGAPVSEAGVTTIAARTSATNTMSMAWP